jgi:uncharacterized OB-fold protein
MSELTPEHAREQASTLADVPMPGTRPFPPRVSAFTRPFWEALQRASLTTTQCTHCGTISFPPRNLCRGCWTQDLRWITLAARGRLYSYTRVHVAPGAFRSDTPYAIGIIDLQHGPRLMCRMIDPVETSDLDGPVEMVVLQYQDGPLFGARVLRPV